MTDLSLQDLANRTGESTERLSKWRTLGFFGAGNGDTFTLDDLGRVQMLQLALQSGFEAEALDRAVSELRGLFDRFMQWLRPAEHVYSLEEAAERIDLTPEDLGLRLTYEPALREVAVEATPSRWLKVCVGGGT